MAGRGLSVEEVAGRATMRRFRELPHVLFREEPRWAAPLAGWDSARLDPHRNPFFEKGDATYLLLRRMGRPAGRITAHIATEHDEEGLFGFFDADGPDSAAALVDAAADWLRDRGCTTMTGPVSFTEREELGVLVAGFDSPGTTGRWWHPPGYSEWLLASGLQEVETSRRRSWRLAPRAGVPHDRQHGERPELIGPYHDRRVVFAAIAAVPDLRSANMAGGRLARRARRGDWEGCTVVRCDGDPAALVPGLLAAASSAGYRWVVAPWSPDPAAAPEAEHALFRVDL